MDPRADGSDGAGAGCGAEGSLCTERIEAHQRQHRATVERIAASAAGGGVRGGGDARAGRRGDAGEGHGAALGAGH